MCLCAYISFELISPRLQEEIAWPLGIRAAALGALSMLYTATSAYVCESTTQVVRSSRGIAGMVRHGQIRHSLTPVEVLV